MMPVMDGIEATRQIRNLNSEYAKNIPIIALTANAIVGNEELFLGNGFQDFVSKPIELARMDVVIRKWIWDEEQEKEYYLNNSLGNVLTAQHGSTNWQALIDGAPGINIQRGLRHYDSDRRVYIDIMRSFARNTPALLESIKNVSVRSLPDYETVVHGIKGSGRAIHADEVAEMAETLEKAASTGDFDYIVSNNSNLIDIANTLIDNIKQMLEKFDSDNVKQKRDYPDNTLLLKLKEACVQYDMNKVDAALDELELYDYISDNGLVEWLRENAEQMNFNEIVERLVDVK